MNRKYRAVKVTTNDEKVTYKIQYFAPEYQTSVGTTIKAAWVDWYASSYLTEKEALDQLKKIEDTSIKSVDVLKEFEARIS